ncbi:MAG: hypothetical protein GYB64_01645, partial [Chloroflexi bacterium]|nr:hypothetical protein [Chloroflexota bacterium]
SGRQLSTALGDAMPFWDRRIDLLVMSGQSEAHLAGLAGVLDRYQIGAVMYTGHRGESSIAREVWSQLEEQDLPLTVPTVGTRIEAADGVRLTVMDPGSDDTPIVLMLIYEEARFLLTGDLDETTQAALGQQSIDATVLQVPDNGHERVSSEDFLGMVSPQVSVISVGANNRFGLPHEATLSRLQDVTPLLYRTDQHGTIHMWTDGSLLWIRER